MSDAREAWITGIGIVSCLGEGADAHWQALSEGKVKADAESFAPYVVHRVVPLDLDKQIPKKGDQRQMEPWLRIGTYAAGLALDSAGVKGHSELLSRMDMIVAAGGGERDIAADTAILSGLPGAEKPEAFLNERLMSDLRPTLFLAQLSNLLAGNISIVHGVTGSSRTFMGEELAGVDAVRIALSRIAAGQSELALVGGSHNGEREDLLLLYGSGGHMLRDAYRPVWERTAAPGMVLGSLGAFIVLEASGHAQARGAKPLARLSHVVSERSSRPASAWLAAAMRAAPTGIYRTIPLVIERCTIQAALTHNTRDGIQAALAVATADAAGREKGWKTIDPAPISAATAAEMGGREPSARHGG